jgi:hypothetical protein
MRRAPSAAPVSVDTGAAAFQFVVPRTQPLAALAGAWRRKAATVEARVGLRRHGRARIAAQPLLVNDDGRRNVFQHIGVRLPVMGHELLHEGRIGSLISLWLSAAVVLKTREDLPEPDTPVNTVIRCLGISSETFLRLSSRVPRILIEPYITSLIQMAERSAKDRRARHGKYPAPPDRTSFELCRQTSIYPRQDLPQVCKELLPPTLGALVGLLLIRPEARLLHAHDPRLQPLHSFLLTTNVSNKSGNLLFAHR